MPSAAGKLSNNRSPSKPKKRMRKTWPVAYPLEYSTEDGISLKHEKLRVHRKALGLRALATDVLEVLRGQIIQGDGSVHLSTPIDVAPRGSIVDGRHRARILVEAGYGDELVKQIEAGGGKWVRKLPKGEDLDLHVARTQMARRNCPTWQVALCLLDRYKKEAAKGKLLQGKRRKEPGAKSPVDEFCDAIKISKTTFHQMDLVERMASAEQMEDLLAGEISLTALDRLLRPAKKARRSTGMAGAPSCSDSMSTGASSACGSGDGRDPDNGALHGRRTKPLAAKSNDESGIVEVHQAANLINRLLQSNAHDHSVGRSAARSLLAALDDAPRQLLMSACHEAKPKRPK